MSLYKSFIFAARKYILLIEKMYVLSYLQRLEQRYTMIFTSPTVCLTYSKYLQKTIKLECLSERNNISQILCKLTMKTNKVSGGIEILI